MRGMELEHRLCLEMMSGAEFSTTLRQKSWIWAAKHRTCPLCDALPNQPCMNLTRRKQNLQVPTKWPHSQRVDWAKLKDALIERGYYQSGKKAQETEE